MYAQVVNNAVIAVLPELPKAHTFVNGSKTGNFDAMTVSEQIAEGYYPLEEIRPDYDPRLGKLVVEGDEIQASKVVRSYAVEDFPLATVKQHRMMDVDRKLQSKLTGSSFTFEGQSFSFHAKTSTDAAELRAALDSGMPFPAGFSWTRADGSEHPMNESQFTLFGLTVAGHKLTLVGTAKAHIAAINSKTAPQDVVDYNIDAGW